MADKIIVSKSKVTNLFDSIRAKSGSTDLMSFDTAKSIVDDIQNGGGIIEVDELPQAGWSGTEVPNSGAYTDIYFNINLSKEEVNPILNQVTFLDSSLLGQSGFEFYPIAMCSIDDTIAALVMKKFSDDDIDVAIVDLTTMEPTRDIFIGSDGWHTTAVTDTKLALGSVSGSFQDSFNGLPVGTQNNLISSVFSSTPFVQSGEAVDGTIYKVCSEPVAVPNSGTVEKLYFNNNLSLDEYHNILSNVTFTDASVLGLSGFSFYAVMAYLVGSVPYVLAFKKFADNNIDLAIINFSNMNVLQAFCDGDKYWFDFDNPYPIGYEVLSTLSGLPIGSENEKLKEMISITPFETKYYLVEDSEFVELSTSIIYNKTYSGTTIPNDGTFVEKIYFNTSLGVGEVVEVLSKLTYDPNTNMVIPITNDSSVFLVIMYDNGVYAIVNGLTEEIYFIDGDVGLGFTGWNPNLLSENNYIEVNVTTQATSNMLGISLEVGTQNEFIKGVVATSNDFVLESYDEKILSGKYDGVNIDVSENGEINVLSIIKNKKFPKKINVNIPEPVLHELTITPEKNQQEITPNDSDGFSKVIVKAVTNTIDSNIQSGNIKEGISILGVNGTLKDRKALLNNIMTRRVTEVTEYISNMIGGYAFADCRSLKKVILPKGFQYYIRDYAFLYCTSLAALIIEEDSYIATLAATSFSSSAISSGTGYIYVPDSLVDNYKTATNWSTYASQIKPLSEYVEE